MKASVFLRIVGFAAALSALMQSCVSAVPEVDALQEYPVVLSVDDPSTKLALEETDLSWEDDDKIRITAVADDKDFGTSELSVYSIDNTDNGKAVFTGFVNMSSTPVDCYFTYPSSEVWMDTDHNTGKITAHFNVQDGRHVSFMYACSGYNKNGMALELNHVGAMLELDVKIEGVVYVR